jgi:hypothetical protein
MNTPSQWESSNGTESNVTTDSGTHLRKSLTIREAPAVVERAWHHDEHIVKILPELESVEFSPASGGRGTEVSVDLGEGSRRGMVAETVGKLFNNDPGQQVYKAMRAFKQVIETGEVVYSDASIHGKPHPAQPPSDAELEEIMRARAEERLERRP